MEAVEVNRDYERQLENTITLFEERIAELEFQREDLYWERLGGEAKFEFSLSYLKTAVARSRLFFLQNPLINRAVSLQADYVFAQGMNVQATSSVVNDVIQAFLDDERNQLELSSHKARLEKEQTLLLDGNVFVVLFTNKMTGAVQARSILIDEIGDILSNPDDANEVWFYKRIWTSKNFNGDTVQHTAYYPDINFDQTINKQQPKLETGETIYWDAPVFHLKTGALAKSRYGVPETYSALDWAAAHQQMLEDWATIIRAYARFAFKLTVSGQKQSLTEAKTRLGTTVTSRAGGSGVESNPTPTVASIFAAKKDGVDIEPIKTSGATTSATDSRQLRLMVAAAMGLPDPMLSGEVDVGNLATAKTLDRPTELKFRSRQLLWSDAWKTILKYIIDASVLAPQGKLNKYVTSSIGPDGKLVYKTKNDPKTKKPINLGVEITFPPILERTITERIDAVSRAVTLNGKELAMNSPELMKLTIRLMLQALGLADVDEHIDLIFANISDDDVLKKPDAKTSTAPDSNTDGEDNSNGDGTSQADNG